jgi:hypothetical protein
VFNAKDLRVNSAVHLCSCRICTCLVCASLIAELTQSLLCPNHKQLLRVQLSSTWVMTLDAIIHTSHYRPYYYFLLLIPLLQPSPTETLCSLLLSLPLLLSSLILLLLQPSLIETLSLLSCYYLYHYYYCSYCRFSYCCYYCFYRHCDCSHRLLRRYEAVGGNTRLRPLTLAEALRLPETIVARGSTLDKSTWVQVLHAIICCCELCLVFMQASEVYDVQHALWLSFLACRCICCDLLWAHLSC